VSEDYPILHISYMVPDSGGAHRYRTATDEEVAQHPIVRAAIERAESAEATVVDRNAEIVRLLEVEALWSKACDVARRYCPVPVGRSHFDPGIPLLAKRTAAAEADRDAWKERAERARAWIVYAASCGDWLNPPGAALSDDPPEVMR